MGLIAKQMGGESASGQPEDVAATEKDGGVQLTSESVRANMNLPKEKEATYDKIVKAGLKLMFDPSTRGETIKVINDSSGDPQKMAEGIAAVMAMLFQESNNTLPPDLIIPAGVELLMHTVEVAKEAGMDIPDNDVAEAMANIVEAVLKQFGVPPEEMQKMLTGMSGGQATPEQPQDGSVPQGV